MGYVAYSRFVPVEGAELYTVILLPREQGSFPTVLFRSPYVDGEEAAEEEVLLPALLQKNAKWLDYGYAVVWQHCRGRGKSTGDCIPYIYEREDGLALRAWVREQSFYNGELFLCGGSYTSSVHYVTVPFESDVKGAVLEVQDCERYNCNYRNGFYKSNLHGEWYFKMYKRKSIPKKNFTPESYLTLPLSSLSEIATGEKIADYDEILRHPRRDDPFWETRYGGGEAHDAVKHARIPILFTTGFYDLYAGGIFDMWNGMDDEARSRCALVVHPYDHGGTPDKQPIAFENGRISEQFPDYRQRWCDAVRGLGEFPITQGKVTYYGLFGRGWCTDAFKRPITTIINRLGEGERTYRYNPYAPARFKGGLSANFGGTAYQDPPNSRYDILTVYTHEFMEETFVKGKMGLRLKVRSTAEDTCFYVRISLTKEDGDYGLRDDVTQISNVCPDYVPGETVTLDFSFDEHAFTVKPGERLRIDISSSAFPHYVRHTNRRGLFSEQTDAVCADNTVLLGESFLEFPCEAKSLEEEYSRSSSAEVL